MDGLLKVLLNYLAVQLAIVLFIAPFYLFFWKRNQQKNIEFNESLENFFQSKQANFLVFFWALGEAIVWFVIPEFLLLLIIFMRIRRKKELLVYDVVGTSVGTLLALIIHMPEKTLLQMPYIQPNMIAQAKLWYDNHGIFGLLFQPFSGVPYKVFANIANDYSFFIPLFLIVAVIVRICRYIIIYSVLSSFQPTLHRFVYRNYVKLFIVSTFIFSALLLRVYLNYGPSYHLH